MKGNSSFWSWGNSVSFSKVSSSPLTIFFWFYWPLIQVLHPFPCVFHLWCSALPPSVHPLSLTSSKLEVNSLTSSFFWCCEDTKSAWTLLTCLSQKNPFSSTVNLSEQISHRICHLQAGWLRVDGITVSCFKIRNIFFTLDMERGITLTASIKKTC